jgi:hypothetical protein
MVMNHKSRFSKALFDGWLSHAIIVIALITTLTVSIAVASDMYYQTIFLQLSKKSLTETAFNQFTDQMNGSPTISIQPTVIDTEPVFTLAPGISATSTPRFTSTPKPTVKVTAVPRQTATNTQTPTNEPQVTSTPTTAQATNTPIPPSGCFVTVSGYLYNMQSGVGSTLTDPNTGKTHIHTTSDYQCGTQTSPTDMTAVYLAKHSTMGCAPRLAQYIVSPPAPTDPTCE